MEPHQNLGINKILIARPIFVLVPGLLNIIFSSHKNIPACKKSAPCGHIWPPFGPIWPRLAKYGQCAHVFASCARMRARIFTKNFVLVFYYHKSLSFKFHTDMSFCCGDIFSDTRYFKVPIPQGVIFGYVKELIFLNTIQ